jgi:hypothetical protein
MTEREPRDYDQQQIRDMHLVFEHVKQGLMTEMAARPVMMEILTRPIRRQAMTERELIRDVREQLVMSCDCVPEYRLDGDGYPVRVEKNDTLCRHCLLVGVIDAGLAEIGKAERLGPRRDRPPTASSRAVAGELERLRELAE